MEFHFRRFRTRILAITSGLLVLVLGAVLFAVNTANVGNARLHIDEALELTASAFRRSLATREQILLEKARLLSADFAFKAAVATGDRATLLSALENHQLRVGANLMMLLRLDGRVLADTLHPQIHGFASPLTPLIEIAMESERGEVAAVEFIDEIPYQLVAVPLYTPEPSAWILIGFALDDHFAEELQRETNTQVSLFARRKNRWIPICSTLPLAARTEVAAGLTGNSFPPEESIPFQIGGEEFVTWAVPVDDPTDEVVAVLQRSLTTALEPYLREREVLLGIFAIGLVLSLLGGSLLSSRVTSPVARLASGAQRIESGNYTEPVEIDSKDELGDLAESFNNMMHGLVERDRVRDMLGKVVSPEVAAELLRTGVEMGGEERVVSIFFSDIRDFTTLAENQSPPQLVAILNTYLTWLTEIIERHGGVVEQYVGDAVMAFFGAPIQHTDDASRAVRVALEICRRLPDINAELAKFGLDPFVVGIGVHTDVVVAGNIGSPQRLNYKVVGDGVNLASRLEGLTKRYRVGAIASEATMNACPDIVFRELDRVRVKGRRQPVTIYEPIGCAGEVAPGISERLALHAEAMAQFRARDWDAAERGFRELHHLEPDSRLLALYLDRIVQLRRSPPGEDWDGTVTYAEK